ncbi:MAG: hypothetical protein HGA67_03740 [Candidatus Yonathbacteria bacterium]|nr:hypothetical protein [Candidatus Yonathbacteria bacterium]
MSTLPAPFLKPLLVQVGIAEVLHNRGNVIAEKAILLAIKNDIIRGDCSVVKTKGGKKLVCIERIDTLKTTAIIDAMIKNLDVPIRERKLEIQKGTANFLDRLIHLFK